MNEKISVENWATFLKSYLFVMYIKYVHEMKNEMIAILMVVQIKVLTKNNGISVKGSLIDVIQRKNAY